MTGRLMSYDEFVKDYSHLMFTAKGEGPVEGASVTYLAFNGHHMTAPVVDRYARYFMAVHATGCPCGVPGLDVPPSTNKEVNR